MKKWELAGPRLGRLPASFAVTNGSSASLACSMTNPTIEFVDIEFDEHIGRDFLRLSGGPIGELSGGRIGIRKVTCLRLVHGVPNLRVAPLSINALCYAPASTTTLM